MVSDGILFLVSAAGTSLLIKEPEFLVGQRVPQAVQDGFSLLRLWMMKTTYREERQAKASFMFAWGVYDSH